MPGQYRDTSGLYGTQRWKRRRLAQLQREPLCAMCLADGVTRVATVADHITPHRGDPHAFFAGRLQSLCAPHHDGAKQREERRGYSDEVGDDGWPLDPRHPANASHNNALPGDKRHPNGDRPRRPGDRGGI